MEERIEVRDGREFRVKVLPPVEPPKDRSKRSRYHFDEVSRPGDIPTRRRKHGKRA